MTFITWTKREKSIITFSGAFKCRSLLSIYLHDTMNLHFQGHAHCYINFLFIEFKILTIET